MKHRLEGAGKGDNDRTSDKKRYDENYNRIFGKKNPISHIRKIVEQGKP